MLSNPEPSARTRLRILGWCFVAFVSSPFAFLFGLMQKPWAWPIMIFAVILFVGNIFVTCYILLDEMFFKDGRYDRHQQALLIAENEKLQAAEAAEKAEYAEWHARVFQTSDPAQAEETK